MPPLAAAALISLGVSATAATVVANVGFAVLSIGLSLLFAPKVEKPENIGRIPIRQPVPSRMRIIGKRRTAGAFLLYHSKGGDTFFGISALCEGEAKEFTRFYLHEDVVELSGGGPYVSYPPGGGRYGDDKVRIYTKLGLPTETAFSVAVDALDPIWTEDHRGDGIAQALLVAADAGLDDHAKRFPYGLPVLSVELIATRVFDGRDMAQDWEDPDTWEFDGNDNPILQAVWLLTAPIKDGGMGLSFEECILPVLDEIMEQADICDEAVPLKAGGTEKRYICGSQYMFSDERTEALNAILGTCDGFCAENGDGTYTIKAGKWDDEDFEVEIADKHVISIKVNDGKPDEDALTGVVVKYNSIPHEHTTVDAPVYPPSAYQGGDDKRVRTIEVTYCPSGTQAQRLSKRVYTYESAPITGTMVLNMYGLLLRNRRGATLLITDDPRLNDVKVKISRCEYNLLAGTTEIDFIVFDPDVCDAWNAATEEGPLQPVVDLSDSGTFSTPTSLNAVAVEVDDHVFLEVAFDPGAIAGNNTNYRYRYRFADVGGGVPGNWITGTINGRDVERPSSTQWIVTIDNIPIGELEIQLQAYQHDRSEWSATETVDTSDPGPGRPQLFSVTLSGRDADLDWTSPNSADFDHAKVYRVVTAGGFLSSDLIAEVPGAPDSAMSYTDTAPGAGTWDYYVTAETAADVASLPTGPETVTTPSGAAYLAAALADVIAIDFLDQTMIVRDAGTPANDYSGTPGGRLTFARAGSKYVFGSDGLLDSISNDVLGYDHHPITLAPRGLWLTNQATDLLAAGTGRDFTDVAWTKTNVTAAKNQVGLDGVTNSASLLTATAGNGTVTQNVTSASANRIFQVWIERVTGTGTIEVTVDGTNWTNVTSRVTTDGFALCFRQQNTVTNPVVGIRIGTSGDAIKVDFANINNQFFASAPVDAGGSRVADSLSLASSFPSWLASPTALTIAMEFELFDIGTPPNNSLLSISDGTTNERHFYQRSSSIRAAYIVTDGGVQQAGITHTTESFVAETAQRVSTSAAANDFRLCQNGVMEAADTSGSMPGGFNVVWFLRSATGGSQGTAWLRRVLIKPATSTNTELQNALL